MPSNITLFLSVLAGYSFIHLFYFTRFRAQRLDGYRLVIESALFGIVLYSVAKLVQPFAPTTLAHLRATFGSNSDLVDTAFVFVVAWLLPNAMNFVVALGMHGREMMAPADDLTIGAAWSELMQPARRAALDWAIRKLGNDLLTLLHDAVSQPREKQTPLLLTLDNNRVYVGWIVRSPNLKTEDEYLSVLPLASGHRNKDTLKVTLDTFYPVHEYADHGGTIDTKALTFVIPYDSIKKANYFNVELYLSHFAANSASFSLDPSA